MRRANVRDAQSDPAVSNPQPLDTGRVVVDAAMVVTAFLVVPGIIAALAIVLFLILVIAELRDRL